MRLTAPDPAQSLFTPAAFFTFQVQFVIFICWFFAGLPAWLICLFNFLLVLSSFIFVFFFLSFLTSFCEFCEFCVLSTRRSQCISLLPPSICHTVMITFIVVFVFVVTALSQASLVWQRRSLQTAPTGRHILCLNEANFFIFVYICKDSFIPLYSVWTEAFIHCHSQFAYLRNVNVMRECGRERIQLRAKDLGISFFFF